ncbi:hypothetical protein AKAW_11340 [Aspergillus luchuensis IFO 4308]|nr:hypothetical protein AKAW_11340 [Aspergillus luchuensis IFO 4308]
MDNASHCSREGSSHCVPQKAVVIGLYGISGVGKSILLDRLKRELGEELFNYHEGSAVIADIVPGGLEAFQSLEEGEKACWRKQAIETIRRTSIETRKIAVVTGHFMFYLVAYSVAWRMGMETTTKYGSLIDSSEPSLA